MQHKKCGERRLLHRPQSSTFLVNFVSLAHVNPHSLWWPALGSGQWVHAKRVRLRILTATLILAPSLSISPSLPSSLCLLYSWDTGFLKLFAMEGDRLCWRLESSHVVPSDGLWRAWGHPCFPQAPAQRLTEVPWPPPGSLSSLTMGPECSGRVPCLTASVQPPYKA